MMETEPVAAAAALALLTGWVMTAHSRGGVPQRYTGLRLTRAAQHGFYCVVCVSVWMLFDHNNSICITRQDKMLDWAILGQFLLFF